MTNMALAVQAIKNEISAQDVGQTLGLEIRHGRCQCPMHGGHDFNCVLYKGNRGFYCHVCKSGGDVISFVQKYYGMSFKDAVSWFNDTFHMGYDLNKQIDPEERRRAENAQRMRKEAIEFQKWKNDNLFSMALTANQIVQILEDMRDRYVPKTPNEEWRVEFRTAIALLQEAREFAEDCWFDCVEENK